MSNIKLFQSKQIRSAWNEAGQKWYFSVQDVVEVLTDSSDIKQYIKKMLSRDEQLKGNWGIICTLVEMEANLLFNLRPKITSRFAPKLCQLLSPAVRSF